MQKSEKIIFRCRGLILYNDELLVVRHSGGKDFLALPGGKLEPGESLDGCLHRELTEELGVEPVIGSLQHVYTFTHNTGQQYVEFFFHVQNSVAYKDANPDATHALEIEEIVWVNKNHDVRILPDFIFPAFKAGTLLSDTIRFEKN